MAVIDGQLQLQDWTDRDGNKRRSAEIVASNVHFGDSKPQNQAAPDGTFSYKIYADYRDEMDSKTAIKILRFENPIQTFWEQLDEWYQDHQWVLGDELEKEVRSKLTANDGPYLGGVSDEDDDRMLDTMHDQVYFKLLGVQPQRMCMSYIDGAYRECLLSAFDSNKKILYAVLNGRIVGRGVPTADQKTSDRR
jgi:single-stranded DNA-binding protein